ncbi:MAG: hypothetical protein AB8B49_06120 [Nitratireductor sp.]
MKIGVTLSGLGHAALLSWGLLNISAPAPLEVAEVESVSVEVIPFSDVSEAVQGEKEADLRDTPAPIPTKRPDPEPESVNIGDTKIDAPTLREQKPAEKPIEVAKAEAPPPAPEPKPLPDVAPEPQTKQEEAPAPTTEVAALTQPAVPVSETPVSEQTPIADEGEQFTKLPESVSAPSERPSPPKPKSAETTDRKIKEKPAKQKTATSDTKQKSKTDELAALIDKQKPTAAGSKSSKKTASLGTKKAAKGKKLSRNEMDGLRSAIESCWSVPSGLADAETMKASVSMNLKKDGSIEGRPTVSSSGGEAGPRRAFASSVLRAVKRCAPYDLPAEKYDTWAEVQVNFDASDLF